MIENTQRIIKENIIGVIAFAVLLVMIIHGCFMPEKMEDDPPAELEEISGDYLVEFPYEDDEIGFGEGWLSQSENEAYRWVRRESFFYANLSDQKTINLSGYVPAGVDAHKVSLYLNGKRVSKCKISGEQGIVLEGNIEKYLKKGGINSFRIVFDKERRPGEDDADQRVFSAMFMSIKFE